MKPSSAPSHEAIIDKVKSIPKLIFSDDFEITVQETESKSTVFKNGEKSSSTNDDSLWISLRLQHQKRPGRAASLYSGEESLNEVVEAAFEAAKHSSPDPWFRFPMWRSQVRDNVPATPVESVPESLYTKLVWRPELLEERISSTITRNSVYRKTERNLLKFEVGAQAVRYSATHRVDDLSIKMSAERAARANQLESEECLEELLRGIYFRRGGRVFERKNRGHVLFGAQPVAQLLRALSPWFSASRLQKGASPLCGYRSEPIGSPFVDISDDPLHERAALSSLYDLEGSLTQKTKLVDKGVMVGALHDVYTATRENRLSTGNHFRRVGSAEPEIQPWHLVWREGNATQEELMKEMSSGLFIDYCSRLEEDRERPNIFIFHGMGWSVSDSTLGEPVWYIRFELDLFDLLRRVSRVGKSLCFFGSVASPSILVENLPLEIMKT